MHRRTQAFTPSFFIALNFLTKPCVFTDKREQREERRTKRLHSSYVDIIYFGTITPHIHPHRYLNYKDCSILFSPAVEAFSDTETKLSFSVGSWFRGRGKAGHTVRSGMDPRPELHTPPTTNRPGLLIINWGNWVVRGL